MTNSPDPAAAERADVALLQQIWGMDEPDARELLRAAGLKVELAVDAWLEAGEQIANRRGMIVPWPRGERLALALRWARERR